MAGKKIGIKAIKKALSECALDPSVPGWFRIVAEADNDYLLRRTSELLQEILAVNNTFGKIDQAIALLGLVKARQHESLPFTQ